MAKKEKKAKKVKEPKAKKPKKRKEKSDGDGAKVFFANHIEKILFGLAALLFLMFVFSGFKNRDVIDSSKTPSALDQQINTTARKVDDFSWERDYTDILEKDDRDFPARATRARQPLEHDSYSQKQLLRPPVSPPRTKRTDPDLFAASSLQVRPGYGILRKESSRSGQRDGVRRVARMKNPILANSLPSSKISVQIIGSSQTKAEGESAGVGR